MEKFLVEHDIPVLCLTADSFPDGIMAAHHILHAIMTDRGRKYFGISHPYKDGTIVYKAAVERISEQEATDLCMETFIIRKGIYNSILIKDYYKNIPLIGEAFRQLLDSPELDPQGACVEMYIGETDVRCMVRLR